MELINWKDRLVLPALGSTRDIPLKEKNVICKFINPIGAGDWYVFEGEEREGDFIFYGVVHISSERLQEFSLKELLKKKLPFGLKVMREPDFIQGKYGEIFGKKRT
jgi:Protein of unknown function (DUF2958)